MATKVHMEALSPTMEEGQVVGWLKHEGDEVKDGDVLAEIETDKATMELVARGSGVLRKVLLAEGGTAPVGSVIAVIGEPDEDIAAAVTEAEAALSGSAGAGAGAGAAAPEPAGEAPPTGQGAPPAGAATSAGTPAAAAAGATTPVAAPARAPATSAPPAPAPPAPAPDGGNGAGGRVKASPLARRLAAENKLEIRGLAGSGPGGRVVKRDVEAALQAGAPGAAGARAPAYRAPGPQAAEVVEVPVSQMRKSIARRLVTSNGPVPTFFLTIEVDMGRMLDAREGMNARLEPLGAKVSVNDLLIKALAMALRQHPEVNASWGETVIRRYGRVHVGVAVAIEDGLITPVIRDADAKGVAQIGAEVRELAGRAREKRLQPDEYTGASFSISNLGMFGIDEFTAIINPPEAGILAVGRVEEKPVVVDGAVVVRPRMRVTMSCDHRVVDGATGARFLQTLRGYLEEPAMMLA